MALIECTECGNRLSDAAATCPTCGAPVPRTPGPEQEQCPFCMALVSSHATTCPSCLAKKGYLYEPRYGVFGKTGTLIWGVVVPAITVIGIPFSLYAAYRLYVTGPRWFQTRHA
ncbi:zinc ribbon domain-containing protein [Sedimenticola hydrogenitrophicus]|uniref:zinc ribbon domain-containing protein n=1 Tax=Sedimenticola hydrogenitrophicus TaxID=2967975 RepID=UPI0021A33452|nr:zinc ribbon domain-containing protein [Sedimenticola hydrogenitrophicus]